MKEDVVQKQIELNGPVFLWILIVLSAVIIIAMCISAINDYRNSKYLREHMVRQMDILEAKLVPENKGTVPDSVSLFGTTMSILDYFNLISSLAVILTTVNEISIRKFFNIEGLTQDIVNAGLKSIKCSLNSYPFMSCKVFDDGVIKINKEFVDYQVKYFTESVSTHKNEQLFSYAMGNDLMSRYDTLFVNNIDSSVTVDKQKTIGFTSTGSEE